MVEMPIPVLWALQGGLVVLTILLVYWTLSIPTVVALAAWITLWILYRREQRRSYKAIPLASKYVLITGCDSGIGLALAEHLAKSDCNVIATVLNPEGQGAKKLRAIGSPRVTVLLLDVGNDDSVKNCLTKVEALCSNAGLWGLVNNAGINFIGEIEMTTMRQYLNVANVNIFGTVRATRAFLPLIRQAKGRIVNITSIRGIVSSPMNAAYNITKFGGETFSEILHFEMQRFGIKVVIIEPGHYGGATGCLNEELGIKRIRSDFDEMWNEASDELKKLYTRKHLDNVLQELRAAAATSYPNVDPVVSTVIEALTREDPEFRYIVDGSNQLVDVYCVLARLRRFMPDSLFYRLALYISHNDSSSEN